MKRPIILSCVGILLIAGAFGLSRFCLSRQQPPDINWSITQKRMANIAWALVEMMTDPWSRPFWYQRDQFPRSLKERSLHCGKDKLVFHDEWNHPLIYRPYGDISDRVEDKQTIQRPPPKPIGEQFLDCDPNGGKWVSGEGNWVPDLPDGWVRKNPDASFTHTGIWIEFIELVSYGKDGQPGGDGEDKDIVLRMYDSRDSDWKQKRTGEEWIFTRKISWRFLNK